MSKPIVKRLRRVQPAGKTAWHRPSLSKPEPNPNSNSKEQKEKYEDGKNNFSNLGERGSAGGGNFCSGHRL
jgi:hypothetical protein